jgi:type VI secretion system secreted protein VgrG
MPVPVIKIDGEQLNTALFDELVITVTQELNTHWWCRLDLRETPDKRFPAEDYLGKKVQILTYDTGGQENVLFGGIIVESELEYEIYGSYSAHLTAVAKSYFLDLAPKRRYFPKQTARDAVQKLISKAGLELSGSMPAGKSHGYFQAEETDFEFIRRLVDDVEGWFRPTSQGIEVQTSFQKGITLEWRGEDALLEFRVTGRLSQPSCNGAHYDPKVMQSKIFTEVKDDPNFYGSAKKMVDAVKTKSRELLPPDYVFQRSRTDTVDDFEKLLKKESRRSLGRTVVGKGISRNAHVRPGDELQIDGDLDAKGMYGVIKVVHQWKGSGYLNHFDCTPWTQWMAPKAPSVRQLPGLVPARVVDNNDPDNSGRIKVQFYWQEETQTEWMTMMAPHAGADRGFMFLPEVGDEVWVAFEEGDPERGRVLGSAWNGIEKPPREEFWGEDVSPNDVKRIVTKGGHRISIVDKEGQNSMVLATPKHLKVSMIENSNETGDAMLALHSDGDIFLSAPNGRIHFHSKFFSREVGS